MIIKFSKYQGAGNDFIMIDCRKIVSDIGSHLVAKLCDRHFGIGADGVILLLNEEGVDFRMKYYNSDGSEATFCGNGGRCIVAFASANGLNSNEYNFIAADGMHKAEILSQNGNSFRVKLDMQDALVYSKSENEYYLNTGTYHLVKFVQDISTINVVEYGRTLRNEKRFEPQGTNVNFVEINGQTLHMRTYEKGVENETLACGTGATASAIAASMRNGGNEFVVHTLGGILNVTFNVNGDEFNNVKLIGPVAKVFDGEIWI